MNILDPNWTPIAGYSHIPAILARLAAEDDDEFLDTATRTGVDSHTPPCPQGGMSRRKEDATP